ncbi:uncharacterized protein Dana_GF10914 [Drosophila ananassae]|uniref:Serine/threonine-protein phosphatase 6 regulatory subunit 3 n=1 Tax=Drosophila ananassae TaxID=7217 RepID=B3MA06_DROAN|nr:serine/threonine-protein phosphatase 6 regulatory subunit 3 [Drosophila ananassae]EDV41226.1 uncharacterized protein Dana_GF10914 [Drosophila ananassae]
MFWDKGYAPSANIEALLEKENSTLEEFLDEEDILQECKTQKKNLVNYFKRPEVIRRLVELITTAPNDDVPMAQRYRYANMSCEILTLGLPSLDEKLLTDPETLQLLYSYLEKEPPLNPLLSSFFSKTFSMLFTKKPEQDWFLYQHMCLQLLEYIKSQKNFLDFICKHFDTPVIPDLIMQMMKDIEGGQLKRNLFEWLTEDKIVERLIAILRNPQETEKHANVADFFCDLINQGRLMRQTEQENDSFEPAFDGSNPILKTIESADTIEALLNVILEPNAQESAILSGISVVLTLIKPITFTDEPNLDRQIMLQLREQKFHQEVRETVITVMAPRLHEFVHVLKNPPAKPTLETTAAVLTPPFGKTRLQVCRVFTALLETKHETIQQAICATEYFSLLLEYFKQYCWNNFLHSELEKALHLVFFKGLSNNNTGSTDTDIFNVRGFLKEIEVAAAQDAAVDDDKQEPQEKTNDVEIAAEVQAEELAPEDAATESVENHEENSEVGGENAAEQQKEEPALNDLDIAPPSEMQTHLIVNCHLVSKLVDYWQHNAQAQAAEKGRRLGYMGHLIKILRHITNCISESEHIAALISSSLSDEAEQTLWQSLIDAETGEFTLAAKQQTKLLANCNPHEENEYTLGSNDYLGELNAWEIGALNFSDTIQDIVFTMDNDLNLSQLGRNIDDEDDDDDEHGEHSGAGDGHGQGHGMFTKNSITLSNLADPWDMDVQFSDIPGVSAQVNTCTANWGADFNADNFADFDAHFSTFGSDLGMSSTASPGDGSSEAPPPTSDVNQDTQERLPAENSDASIQNNSHEQQAEYDNNANVEKAISEKLSEAGVAEATSIVTRLQSVLLDGEDDYEDDEGMWTKPLGEDRATETEQTTPVLNGPTSKVNEFNHANDNSSSDVDGHEAGNDTAEQQKLAASATKTNNVEIATTTT